MTYVFSPEFGPRREHMSDLLPGAKVRYRNMTMPAEVLSGPHKSPGRDRYLIRKADGNVSLVPVTEIERVVPRLERVADTLARRIYNRPLHSMSVGYRRTITEAAADVIRTADVTRDEA